jgi:hypothetical protein
MVGLVSLGRKGLEVVLAAQAFRGDLQKIEVQRSSQRPLEPTAEGRGGGLVHPDIIAVPAGDGGLSGVESG